MLRLDRTVTHKVLLHHDQDAEDFARWQTMTVTEKQAVLEYLRWQAKALHAFSKLPRSSAASNEEK
ncbi:hypothetical protein AUC43_10230 [Hymenobacter sedentarius]|uniref:Uncharacterized protein n=1 Tax=Hymenobacter sedentarius TaxID=1411621 RepID=A0A0U3JYM5_9BACT|nr:hypothetical protein [Hymenobacter sedentarius]ALW85439.1 hypothetical protein AUC43_10230 [Hymenobacter sedentarius]